MKTTAKTTKTTKKSINLKDMSDEQLLALSVACESERNHRADVAADRCKALRPSKKTAEPDWSYDETGRPERW